MRVRCKCALYRDGSRVCHAACSRDRSIFAQEGPSSAKERLPAFSPLPTHTKWPTPRQQKAGKGSCCGMQSPSSPCSSSPPSSLFGVLVPPPSPLWVCLRGGKGGPAAVLLHRCAACRRSQGGQTGVARRITPWRSTAVALGPCFSSLRTLRDYCTPYVCGWALHLRSGREPAALGLGLQEAPSLYCSRRPIVSTRQPPCVHRTPWVAFDCAMCAFMQAVLQHAVFRSVPMRQQYRGSANRTRRRPTTCLQSRHFAWRDRSCPPPSGRLAGPSSRPSSASNPLPEQVNLSVNYSITLQYPSKPPPFNNKAHPPRVRQSPRPHLSVNSKRLAALRYTTVTPLDPVGHDTAG